MNTAKQTPTPTVQQSLTLLGDYVSFHAPHASDCMSRIPYVPKRGFQKRECNCALLDAKENARVVRNSFASLSAQNEKLREALKESVYEIGSNKQFAGSIELEPSSNTKRILKNARALLSPSLGDV